MIAPADRPMADATRSAPTPRAELRASVRAAARNRPGVYRMVGPGDRVLYVGKSVHVRTRLLSYFREARGSKGEEILRHTHRIEWEDVPSEFAALLVEMKSIKRWRPPYNVVHKRDRAFAFIRLTREAAPRLQATPRVVPDGSTYYGPFAGPEQMRVAVREIGDVLELRDCARTTPIRYADQLDLFDIEALAPLCLRGDVGRCLAPCVGRCTRTEYQARAELALRFLRGEADAPIAVLKERMDTAVALLRFEHAAVLRDRIARLEALREELLAARAMVETLSFVYPVSGQAGDDRVYVIRRGQVVADLSAPRSAAERAVLVARARRLLQDGARALYGVGATEATEILMVARWFRRHAAELQRVWRPDDPELDVELPA
jgi:excinuclease ABC subunit C